MKDDTVYYAPTTIPAQPDFFVAEYVGADDDHAAEFELTPVIAWLIQPTGDHKIVLGYERERYPNECGNCNAAIVTPIVANGFFEGSYTQDYLIKHPDGSFTRPMGEARYNTEAAALAAIDDGRTQRSALMTARAKATKLRSVDALM